MKQSLKASYIIPLLFASAVGAFICSLLLKIGLLGSFYVFNSNGISIKSVMEYTVNAPSAMKFLLLFGVLFIAFCILGIIIKSVPHKFWNVIFKYRYLIAVIIFIICVVFELSGSSISFWGDYIKASDTGTLFRTANPFRSDEFAVNSVLAIAQGQNPYESYPYFSDIVRGTSTDMFIVYGQPVWNIGIIFRPFQIGYLFLGSSRGLSFFWCLRMLVLLLVSFDFGMMLTRKNRWLSVMYTIFVSFSPVISWWFAINGLVEMIIFGQLCVMMLNAYMRTDNWKKKICYALAFFYSGCCYILVFYPAWQVSLGFVFLVLFIWIIIENRKNFHWKWKEDTPIILLTGILFGAILIYLLAKSFGTIEAVMNTAYPGKRISSDKISLLDLFSYGYNLFLPFVESNGVVAWTFIDFFPLGIVTSVYCLITNEKKDKLLILLLALLTVILVIYIFPVPVAILKITMLSQVPAMRIIVAIGLINLLLLFRSVAFIRVKKPILIPIIAVIYSVVLCILTRKSLQAFSITRFMIVCIAVFFAIAAIAIIIRNDKNITAFSCVIICGIIAACGIMVNPIQKGMDFILKDELVSKIHDIAKEDKGKWIVEGMGFPMNNFTLFAGAPTINSTNVYPQTDTWRKLDTTGEYEEIYNRYAHILVNVVNNKTDFELIQADYFKVNIDVNDLESLDVSYILTNRTMENYTNDDVTFNQIDTYKGYYIYNVVYH